jgi:hypothetical protein
MGKDIFRFLIKAICIIISVTIIASILGLLFTGGEGDIGQIFITILGSSGLIIIVIVFIILITMI